MSATATQRRPSAGRVPAAIRRAHLLEIVGRDGFVAVSRIAETLGVSEMTVRRDLEALQEKGLVDRTFGGAIRREVYEAEEPAFDRRRRVSAGAKSAIARQAAALVQARETIGIDVGTTALSLAEALVPRSDISVFTNNLRAAIEMSASKSPVYVPGGQVRATELSVVGATAIAQLRTYFLDRVFIGVSGITESGCYDYSIEDTEVKRTFIERAGCVVVLAASDKFDRRSLALVAAFDAIDILVTDAEPPAHIADALRRGRVELIVTGVRAAAGEE